MNEFLHESKYFSAVINAMSDLIRVVDLNGQVVLTNRAMQKKMGNCIGKICYECFGAMHPCQECNLKRVLVGEQNVSTERHIDGRHYSVTAAPVKSETNKTVGVVEVFRDVTEIAMMRDQLFAINSKMLTDLSMARNLQRAMVDKTLPNISGYLLSSGFYPCEAIGGDVFDCILLKDGRLLLYVADVSGHGVRAAMLTVFIQQQISMLCKRVDADINLCGLLYDVQKAYLALNTEDSAYITMFACILTPATGMVEYINAGHSVPPILKTRDALRELFLAGPPICRWNDRPVWHTDIFQMAPGDRLLLYTDGLINPKDFMRSNKILQHNFSQEPFESRTFIDAQFGRMQTLTDDLLFLVCERQQEPG